MGWRAYEAADAAVALTPWEAHLMCEIFRAKPERVHVVPNGVERVFLDSPEEERGKWLVCTATITERKRVLELARAAAAAEIPVWIVGRPYTETDAYYQEFRRFADAHCEFVRYEGAISSRAELARVYRQARGFVLLSTMESLSLAALEAAACRCPLLLSDLPWARTTFVEDAIYCPVTSAVSGTASVLKEFYERAPHLKHPPLPQTWDQIGLQLKGLYEALLRARS